MALRSGGPAPRKAIECRFAVRTWPLEAVVVPLAVVRWPLAVVPVPLTMASGLLVGVTRPFHGERRAPLSGALPTGGGRSAARGGRALIGR